jgi:hypothetical protein
LCAEEANGNGHMVGRIIDKMMLSLQQYQVIIDREQWIKEAGKKVPPAYYTSSTSAVSVAIDHNCT